MKFSLGKMILIFTIVPFVELYLLFKIAELTSALTALVIIIITGVVGAYLAKSQGLKVFNQIQDEFQRGVMPKDKLIEGFCILIGGILLLTPGVITDFIGFTLIIPMTRLIYAKTIKKFIKNKISGKTTTYSSQYTVEIDQEVNTDDDNDKGPLNN
jgi:UPF0716 protein FxsA